MTFLLHCCDVNILKKFILCVESQNTKPKLINSNKLDFASGFLFIRDHGGIQTPDRWSRNPVLYSAELRGLIIL